MGALGEYACSFFQTPKMSSFHAFHAFVLGGKRHSFANENDLQSVSIAMENGPFEDVFPIKNGDIPLLC